MPSNAAFQGSRRKLVLTFDVGTTYSGISYCILDPGQVPEIKGVTNFPGHEPLTGSSKIPTIIYYDRLGKVRAVGAEATTNGTYEMAEQKNWIKAEWFKLHLRSKYGGGNDITKEIPPLPLKKTIVDVFADFLKYLYKCASSYIKTAHANGADLWKSVSREIDFVLSHPNGWEGMEQMQMRKAAVLAGLIPDNAKGHGRLTFVTEGEASLHFSIAHGLPQVVVKNGEGIVVVDAGGGTIDVSSYSKNVKVPKQMFEEIAVPQCHFHGSVFVTIHARLFLQEFLAESPFFDDIDHIAHIFDNTTKLRFRDAGDAQYVKFGSTKDTDPNHKIHFGQLKLAGSDVASFFQPSVDCIVSAVLEQQKMAKRPISHVVLVGGFAASAWLCAKVKAALCSSGLAILIPDSQVNKAVSDGAISFYLDHFVRTRVSKFTYGCIAGRIFEPMNAAHKQRASGVLINLAGQKEVSGGFGQILNKDTQVSEIEEFRKRYLRLSETKRGFKSLPVAIWAYRGSLPNPQWKDEDAANFTKVCSIEFNLSHLPLLVQFNEDTQKTYYRLNYDIVLLFGLTELKAQLAWMENGVEKRTQAKVIYD